MVPVRRLWVVLAFVAVLGACTDEPAPRPELRWTEHSLAVPPGPPGRTVVRDAVECGGSWYVVGAVFLAQPTETWDTRPAIWRSTDAQTWSPLDVRTDTYWGKRAILNSIACSRDRIAVVGARSGGAHGNPRVTTFYLEGDVLEDVRTVFTQYGGISATSVGPVTGGPAGWLIAGNRLSGPGVWVTDDPTGFTRVEGEPGLTDDDGLVSLAQGGAWAGDGWLLVGAGAHPGQMMDRDPLAWASADGLTWVADEMPARADEGEDVHRAVLRSDGTVVAVGLSGTRFASWTRIDGTWEESVRFGRLSSEPTGAPYVATLVDSDLGVLATVSTGADYELWLLGGDETWQRLDVPLTPQTAGDHALAVGGGGSALVLVADAGEGGRLWTAPLR